MDFNKGSNLEQATTEKGKKRYNVQFSKITKSWSWKPIKKEKGRSYFHRMVKEAVECVKKKQRLEKPLVPDLPKNIASIPKPDKTGLSHQKATFTFWKLNKKHFHFCFFHSFCYDIYDIFYSINICGFSFYYLQNN